MDTRFLAMVKVEPEPSLTGLSNDKCVPTVTFCLPHVEHTIVDIDTDKVNGECELLFVKSQK